MKNILKIIIIILIATYSEECLGQELFTEIPIKVGYSNSKETTSIVDKENNINLFFIKGRRIDYLKINNKGEEMFTNFYKSSSNLNTFANILRGHTITDNNQIILYFSNELNTSFKSVSVPMSKEAKYEVAEFKINESNTKQLFYATGENKFYIYKYVNKSSIIKRYEVLKEFLKTTVFDLSKEKFYDSNNKICDLSTILKKKKLEENDNIRSFGYGYFFNNHYFSNYNDFLYYNDLNTNKAKTSKPKTIDNSLPSSIEIASRKIKTYVLNDQHLLTLNHRRSATRIIKLSTKNDEFEVSYFSIPMLGFTHNKNSSYMKANSFIYKDKIFQFICSTKRLNINAYNMKTKELIKEYVFTDNDEFTISNSPITQKGGAYMFGGERVLKKTSQLLRKLTNGKDTGIFVYEIDGVLHLSLGAKSEIRHGGGFGFGFPGAGGVGVISSFASSTFSAYHSYTSSKSVQVDCLFDPITFNHIDGKVVDNIFDKANNHTNKIKEDNIFAKLKLETLFSYDNYFMQGYYDKKLKKYKIIKHL